MRPILLAVMVTLAACADRHLPDPATLPPDSPLRQLRQGMRQDEVISLLGEPTDKETPHATGEIWVPFYLGDDAFEQDWHYQGLGRVRFAAGIFFPLALYEVEPDPSESGYYER